MEQCKLLTPKCIHHTPGRPLGSLTVLVLLLGGGSGCVDWPPDLEPEPALDGAHSEPHFMELIDDQFSEGEGALAAFDPTLQRLTLARVEMAPQEGDWALSTSLDVSPTAAGLRIEAGPGVLSLRARNLRAGLGHAAVVWLGARLRTLDGGQGQVSFNTEVFHAEGDVEFEQTIAAVEAEAWSPLRHAGDVLWYQTPEVLDATVRVAVSEGAVELAWPSASASFEARGHYVSQTWDLGGDHLSLVAADWFGSAAPTTTVHIEVRAGASREAMAAAPWSPVGEAHGRFLQYRVSMETSDPRTSPQIERIELRAARSVGPVSGIVRHALTGAPVHGARVQLGDQIIRSRADGVFNFRVAPGSRTLAVTADLFHPAERPVEVDHRPRVATVELHPTNEWPQFRGGSSRTGRSPAVGAFDGPPRVAWSIDLPDENMVDGAFTADVDGDGVFEILTVERERIVVRRGDGELLWRSSGGVANEVGAIIAVADLDADGQVEVVGGNRVALGAPGRFRLGRLVVLDGATGALRSVYDTTEVAGRSAADLQPEYAHIGNFDADPELEAMLSGQYSKEVQLVDFSEGADSPALRWRGTWPTYKNYIRIAAGDLDGDRAAEAVLFSSGHLVVLDGQDGHLLEMTRVSESSSSNLGDLFLIDVDGDGDREVLVVGASPTPLALLDRVGDRMEFIYHHELAPAALSSSNSVMDFDADGDLDLVITTNHVLRVFDVATGAPLHVLPDTDFAGGADLTGDGVPEIVAHQGRDVLLIRADQDYQIIARLPEMGLRRRWHPRYGKWNDSRLHRRSPPPGELRARAGVSEVFGDIDGDGVLDMVTRNYGQPNAVAWSFAGEAPRELWRVDLSESGLFDLSPDAIGDMDGDGRGETVIQLSDGRLLVIDAEGLRRTEIATHTRIANSLVADLEGDGVAEILLTSSRGGPVDVVRVSEGVPERQRLIGGRVATDSPYLAWGVVDLEGDGVRELVSATDRGVAAFDAAGAPLWALEQETARLTLAELDGYPGADVYVEDHDTRTRSALSGRTGALLWSHPLEAAGYGSGAADLDEDGLDSIFMVDTDDAILGLRGATGLPMVKRHVKPLSASGTVIIADLDGDGGRELVSSGNFDTAAMEPDGTILWAERRIGETLKSHFAALIDVDGDGGLDVIQPGGEALVAIHGSTGEELWRYEHTPPLAFGSALVADLNADGESEIVVTSNAGVLLAMDRHGHILWRFEMGDQMGRPIFADVDGDGLAELLVSSASTLYALSP